MFTFHRASEAISPRCLRLQKTHVYTEATRAFKNLLLISATQTPVFFYKNQEFGNRTFDWVRLPIFSFVSMIWVDCRIQSNLIHGLGSIEFSSIGFDLLARVLIINNIQINN